MIMLEVKNAVEFKTNIEIDINEPNGSISSEDFIKCQIVEVHGVTDSDFHPDLFADIFFPDGSVAKSVLKESFDAVGISENIA